MDREAGMRRNSTLAVVVAGAVALLAGTAQAQQAQGPQDWPSRPLKIITGFPAGSGVDVVARLVADTLGRAVGQTVIVEPHAGAGGNVGTEYAAKSAPDGYSLYLGTTGTQAAVTALYHNLPFDPRRDFAPVTPICDVPHIALVNKQIPVKTLPEFIAYLKANPGKVNYASSGNGTAMHLTTEQFKTAAHVSMIHIPYRASPQAVADLISGQVQVMFHQVPAVIDQVKAGLFTTIGVTSETRVAALPDIPTLAESGLPGFESSTWMGILAPAGTPKPVIERVNRALNTALKADLGRRLADLGTIPRGSSPEAFAREIDGDVVKWSAIVKAADIKLD
jgi:tripartite-type tricarboxylate transporter receptor subunit TctC